MYSILGYSQGFLLLNIFRSGLKQRRHKMAEIEAVGEEVNPHKGEDNYQAWFNNSKLTYDKTLEQVTKNSERSSDFGMQVGNVALQALQNAVETANLIGKNAADNANLASKHGLNNFALSVNKQWNMDVPEAASQVEVLKAVGVNQETIGAIQAAVASAIADALKKA